VIFSVILVSNFAIYAASQDRAVLNSQADEENLLNSEETILTGAAATNILFEAQSILAAGPINCSDAQRSISSQLAELVDTQSSGPLVVSAASSEVPGVVHIDNLSMASPFNGSVLGSITISLTVSSRTIGQLDGVSLDRTVNHLVHLPVRWGSLVGDCHGALASIAEAVSSSTVSNCTSSVVDPLLAAAGAGPGSTASADGFAFGLTHYIVARSPCEVGFSVTLGQAGIDGPGGPFSVVLEGSGAATFF
jgi:hypothetical protein